MDVFDIGVRAIFSRGGAERAIFARKIFSTAPEKTAVAKLLGLCLTHPTQ